MDRNEAVLGIFLEKIRRDYAKDISLVLQYGSTVSGTAHEKSDVDLVFVPQTRRGYELAISFIVEDVGYDFFPMRWERLERIASLEESLASIVACAKVIYASSREHEERFEQLRGWVYDALEAPPGMQAYERAVPLIERAMRDAAAMQLADAPGEARYAAAGVLIACMEAIATMNNKIIRRSTGHWPKELSAMPSRPDGLDAMIEAIVRAADPGAAREAAWALLRAVRAQHARMRVIEPRGDSLEGAYEESCCNWRHKLANACREEDAEGAFLTAACFQQFLTEEMGGAGIGPLDVMGAYDPENLAALGRAAEDMFAHIREEMVARRVPLREYADVEAYRAAMLD